MFKAHLSIIVMPKSKRPSFLTQHTGFTAHVIEQVIIPRSLVRKKWFDNGESGINWDMWENAYRAALERRSITATAHALDEKAKILLALLEAVALSMCMSGSYVGTVELQLITHGMIYHRFASNGQGSWGERFYNSIKEMEHNLLKNNETTDSYRLSCILTAVRLRVLDMRDPIISAKQSFLCYPVGTIFGLDAPVNY